MDPLTPGGMERRAPGVLGLLTHLTLPFAAGVEPGEQLPHERLLELVAYLRAHGYSAIQIGFQIGWPSSDVRAALATIPVQKLVEEFTEDLAETSRATRSAGKHHLGHLERYAFGVLARILSRPDIPTEWETKYLTLQARVALGVLDRAGHPPAKHVEVDVTHGWRESVADMSALAAQLRAKLGTGEVEIVDAEVVPG